ncbi:DUF927 domain-containing protein [Yoonia vestfoldensis]|uniref:DNA primase domain protein n=1 Tax=Yoonia vestfoldensis SKA53 TaxID=314232 RepID=A3V8A1_9RHOB|nr:DUF927 domain-containing protein [Yoonia vestfoldensis]EAQ05553.1 DNA primase domain protein [Yoonia vestfoldensis SKA53]
MDDRTSLVAQLLADSEAARQTAEVAEAAVEAQRQYADFGGALHMFKVVKDKQPIPVRLCNFTAEIEREVVKADGLTTARHFTVSGRMETGNPLPTIDVPASEFDRLEWLATEWGASPQIFVGSRYRDHVAAAIKERSDPELVQLCQHTGWAKFDDELLYLTASGGIGTEGLNEEARCELQGSLADFSLPAPADPRTLGLADLLGAFRDVQKDGVGLVLLGGVMRATLCHFMPATLSIYLQGTTGTFKSAFAGVLQGFWGIKFDGANLPANWSSTGNALEKTAFLAKDALLIVDDFVARGTRHEVAKTHANAERLLRAQGNQAGRSRMTSKAELRNAFHPRGIILATGEDIPNGHSLQARLVIVNVARGAIDTTVLSGLQKLARDGVLAKVMASFVQWLAMESKRNALHEFIGMALEIDRENIGASGHARTQDNLANLLMGLRVFLDFADDAGEISSQVTQGFMDIAKDAACALADLQSAIDHEASDAQRFVDLMRAAVSSGKAHIERSSGGKPDNARALGWRDVDLGQSGTRTEAMGTRIGWVDGEELYLDPTASLSVIKALASGLDNHLGSSERAIAKSLREAGLLSRCDKSRNTTKVSVLGARRSVYVFRMADIFDLDSASASPIGHGDADIPF